jgi:hypothetical protein
MVEGFSIHPSARSSIHHLQAKGDGGGGGKDVVRGPVQAPFTAMRITRELTRSSSIAQLAAVFTEHRAELDEIHLTATLTRAAKLAKQQQGDQNTPAARALIASAIRSATPRLPQFKPREIASAAHALASMGEFDAPFFEALAAEARQPGRLSSFTSQNLANTAYAYGRLAKQLGRGNLPPPYLRPLLAAVVEAGRPILGSFEPQHISNTLLALAWAGVYDAGFVEAALDASRVLLAGHGTAGKPVFEPQHLSNTAWALQQLRHRDEGFMRELLQQAVVREGELSGQNIANTVYAAAMLAVWEGVEGLGQLGARLAAASPSSFSSQNVANLALAHAVMGLQEPWLVGLVAGVAAAGGVIPLHQVQLHLYAQALAAQPGGVPLQLQQFTGQWASSVSANARGKRLLPFPATVLRALQRMGLDAAAQPGSLNAMIVRQQVGRVVTVVAVTAIGLTRTQPPSLMGTRLLDLRLAAGAKGSAGAVAVTEPEWEALGGDAGTQEALLRARLAQSVPPPMPPPPSPLSAAAMQQMQQLREQRAVAGGPSSGGLAAGAPSPAPSKPQARQPAAPQSSAQEQQERNEQLERDSREAREALRAVLARHQPPVGPAAQQAVGPRRPASRPGAPPPPGNAAAA